MSPINTAIIPLAHDQRRAWIHFQLRLRGLSMAAIARREGLARNTPKLALYQPYPRMERIIAGAIDCTPQQIWPERFHADGTRKRAKPGPKPKTIIRKDSSATDGGNVSAEGGGVDMSRHRDSQTLDLFEVPMPPPALPASMDYRAEVAELVSLGLKEGEGDRYEVAARMSRLSGHEVSKYMLDAWASTARDAYNMPFYQAPVIEAACDTYLFSNWLAAKRGGRLLVGKETLMAELGKLERMKQDIAQKTRELKKLMGEME